jgi:predicted peptidase
MKTSSLILSLFIYSFCFAQKETKGNFKFKVKHAFELNYILQKPDTINEMKPLIVFLHGSGEKGNDLEKVKAIGPLKYTATNKLDAYILAPQCEADKYWESEELYLLIKKIIKDNKTIDTNRIYLTGLSMGAWGTWNLAYAHPNMFAAIVPIASYVDRVPMIEGCTIKNIPIRMYHGLLDDVVDIFYSKSIYNKIKDCCKDIKFTIFDDAKHDSWSRVYENAEIYNWMLKQKK